MAIYGGGEYLCGTFTGPERNYLGGSFKAGIETVWVVVLKLGVTLFGRQFRGWDRAYLGGGSKAGGGAVRVLRPCICSPLGGACVGPSGELFRHHCFFLLYQVEVVCLKE